MRRRDPRTDYMLSSPAELAKRGSRFGPGGPNVLPCSSDGALELRGSDRCSNRATEATFEIHIVDHQVRMHDMHQKCLRSPEPTPALTMWMC